VRDGFLPSLLILFKWPGVKSPAEGNATRAVAPLTPQIMSIEQALDAPR